MPDSTKTAAGNQLIKKDVTTTISSDTGEQKFSKSWTLHKDIPISFNSVI